MRKSLFFILLATAAMPALAAGPNQDREDRRAARAERSENAKEEKAQRPQRAERAPVVQRVERAPVLQRVERGQRATAPRIERSQYVAQPSGQARRRLNDYSARRNRTAPVVTRDSTDGVTDWRSRERRVRATSPTIPTTTQSTTSRYSGTHYDRDGDRRRWSGDWRRDHRYDWRNHRSRYSSLYRLGRYYDPFGYGYRRWSIGLFLGSGYYGSNYWLNDPWQYRLPPAYGPYRWVRYYDDALLVDIYSGQVVDVIYGFFW